MNRVRFLIDGFNLYHSLEGYEERERLRLRWLDLDGLCRSMLHLVGNGAEHAGVEYFTSLARHREGRHPGTTSRHLDYINAVRSTGVQVFLGNFKGKPDKCLKCGVEFIRHEEKETDVAIASRLIEVFVSGMCETAVLITGDSDLTPAIRTVKRLCRNARVVVAFPFNRKTEELASVADKTFKISASQYQRYQLPAELIGPDGRTIRKPARW